MLLLGQGTVHFAVHRPSRSVLYSWHYYALIENNHRCLAHIACLHPVCHIYPAQLFCADGIYASVPVILAFLISFFILFTCIRDSVLVFRGEMRFWSLWERVNSFVFLSGYWILSCPIAIDTLSEALLTITRLPTGPVHSIKAVYLWHVTS